jgi:hypothetical protein
VPSEVPAEAAEESVRLTALAVNFGLQQAIGDLDRIAAWAMLNGWVNAALATQRRHSSSIPSPTSSGDVFGPDIGAHARIATSVATVPLNLPLVVSAEVELS